MKKRKCIFIASGGRGSFDCPNSSHHKTLGFLILHLNQCQQISLSFTSRISRFFFVLQGNFPFFNYPFLRLVRHVSDLEALGRHKKRPGHWHVLLQWHGLAYCIVFCFRLILNVVLRARFQCGSMIHGLSLGATAGTLAGNMRCTRVAVVLVGDCLQNHECGAWHHWISWMILSGGNPVVPCTAFMGFNFCRDCNSFHGRGYAEI